MEDDGVNSKETQEKRSDDNANLSREEKDMRGYSEWINASMEALDDTDLKDKLGYILPLEKDGSDFYRKMEDGILMCALLEMVTPNTVDWSKVYTLPQMQTRNMKEKAKITQKRCNIDYALKKAKEMGITVNTDSESLMKGGKNLLGFVWQIIERFLVKSLNLPNSASLKGLLKNNETLVDLLRLLPAQLQQRQAAAPKTPSKPPTSQGPNEWKYGLFQCCQKPKICFLGWLCLPCLLCHGGTAVGLTSCFPFRCLACLLPCASAARLRTETRTEYDLEGSWFGDVIRACFCTPCAGCQIENELQDRKGKK